MLALRFIRTQCLGRFYFDSLVLLLEEQRMEEKDSDRLNIKGMRLYITAGI